MVFVSKYIHIEVPNKNPYSISMTTSTWPGAIKLIIREETED